MLRVLDHTRPDGPMTTDIFDPLLFGLFLAIAIAAFVVYIFVVQYIYKDAVKRDLNAELWLIIIFLTPIIGIIVYFIVRNVKSRS